MSFKKFSVLTLAFAISSISLRADDGHFEVVGSGESQYIRVRSGLIAARLCGYLTLKAKKAEYAEYVPVYDPETKEQFSIPRFVLVAELWNYPGWSPLGQKPPYKLGTVGRVGLAEDQTYIFDNKDYHIHLYEVIEKDKATGGGWNTPVNITLLRMKKVPVQDYIEIANYKLKEVCSGLLSGVAGHVKPLNMADDAPYISNATTEFKQIPAYAE